MKKRVLFALCICALLTVFSVFASAASISSANDMLTLMNTPSMWAGDYTLTADIDLAEATNGLSQAPIGNATTKFTGTFDGGGHTVRGLSLTGYTTDYVGLFGYAANAEIQNLTVEGQVSSTGSIVGGVVGGVNGASISIQNCTNRCTVNGAASVAGMIGRIDAGSGSASISGCKNEGAVTGSGNYVGGIIGTSTQNGSSITLEKSMNTAKIKGAKYVGGIVGYWRVYAGSANKCTLQDCINTGDVHTTSTAVGGIMGVGNGANYAYTLTRVFNSGNVTAGGSAYVRPVAGATSKKTNDGGKMTYCYYSSTGSYTSDATGYSAANETYVADPTVAANFPGLMTNDWIVVDGYAPALKVFHTHTYVDGVCTVCGAEDIPCAHENKYDVVVTAATCTAPGVKYEYCPDCDTQIGENIVIPIDANNHSGTFTMAVSGTAVTYTCPACGKLAYTDAAPLSTVYVSSSGRALTGRMDGQLGTVQDPFKNFADAMQYAAYAGKDVTINILDTASVGTDYETPAFSDTVTVTGGTLVTQNRFNMNGKVVFEHITISPSVALVMAAKENKLVMGEGITVSGSNIFLVGGYENRLHSTLVPATGYSTDITVRSGVYQSIGGANRFLSNAYSGTVKLTIGKTNANDTLRVTEALTALGLNSDGAKTVDAALIIDGPIDYVRWVYPNAHATSLAAEDCHVDLVVRGTVDSGPSDVVMRGTGCTLSVYADPRVAGAENLAALLSGANEVQPYKRYCIKVNGTHPDANSDEICDNCGAPTVCAHEYGEWRETAEATCTDGTRYVWYCYDCLDTIDEMTKTDGAVDPDNHVAAHFAWNYDGAKYYFICESCGVRVEQAKAPTIYLSAGGNDQSDGRTPDKAVATLPEAVGRIASTGGTVTVCGSYPVSGRIDLPAHTGKITICGYDADNGDLHGGFKLLGLTVLSLGGQTTVDTLSFDGNATMIFVCNWNDAQFGKAEVVNNAHAYIVLGSYQMTEDDNKTAAATLTITEGATLLTSSSGALSRTRFYAYVYLGDTFGAEGVSVANKTAVLNATDADIGVLYTMSTSSSYKNNPVTNCETTVNLYGDTTINQGRTGDFNAGYADSTGAIQKQTINFFDNASIGTDYYIRNAEHTVLHISGEAQGRTRPLRTPFTFYAYGTFAAANTSVRVEVDHTTHSFAPSVTAPLVFQNVASAQRVVSENVTDECVYTAKVTKAATPEANGTKLYSCTCGRSYTEPFAYSCTDSTHVYLAKADGGYECTVCGGKFDSVQGDICFALAPVSTDSHTISIPLTLDAAAIAAAQIRIAAPEGFTFTGASIPEVAGFVLDAAEVDGETVIAIVSTSGEDAALAATLSLNYSIAQTVVPGNVIFTITVPEAYDRSGGALTATPVSAEMTVAYTYLAVTDADAFIDGEGMGNVRLITTATVPGAKQITGYGMYFIPLTVFTGDGESLTRAVRIYTEDALGDGETFSADLLHIPAEFANETVVAIAFCLLGGEEVTTTQYTFSVNEFVG
ncbi:MAG: hypothetical protein IJS44_05920 [Clostridia bacterium]|nr:hypothetical protein [Clostridia bacterium]